MINTRLKAQITGRVGSGKIELLDLHGDVVATFSSEPFFYIVTGFKTVEAFNAHQDDQPTKFLLWKREH